MHSQQLTPPPACSSELSADRTAAKSRAGTAQAYAVLQMEPFEQPLELHRLCKQVTEIWCRAVYTDPDRPLSLDAEPANAASAPRRTVRQP